ncbi:hypothetical protein [Streptomyces platensis]|uniref:hypothetical protein n=1 Tax=Streptomyces platensis TaxID=58346 RepID=UPI00331D419C
MKDHQASGARRGMRRGTKYTVPKYDPASGDSYRPGTSFDPQTAAKLIRMSAAVNMSISGFLNALVEAVEEDPATNTPAGWPQATQLREAG